MNQNNYLKTALIVPKIKLGDPLTNAQTIIKLAHDAQDAAIIVFPELTISGYSLGDWFFNQELLKQHTAALQMIVEQSNEQVWLIGGVLEHQSSLYNVSYVIQNKKILGIVPKINLPSYQEFFENRIFTSGRNFYEYPEEILVCGLNVPVGNLLFEDLHQKVSFGIEICEDLWQNNTPHQGYYQANATLVFNLSASTFHINKDKRRVQLCNNASYLGKGAYLYISTGISETSSDVVFSGHAIACELGETILDEETLHDEEKIYYVDIDLEAINKRRLETSSSVTIEDLKGIKRIPYGLRLSKTSVNFNRPLSKYPFALQNAENAEKVITVIKEGLYHRLSHIGINKVVLGISGGLDSTLALLFAWECFKKHNFPLTNILAFTLPGLGTGPTSKGLAHSLMNILGVKAQEIDIRTEALHHFDLIGQDNEHQDVTYENIQARYRTLTLMNIANKEQAIVVGTSDMSEIALGWSTFNGDQMAMYNLNAGLPKTVVKELVIYFAEKYPELHDVLMKVAHATITPELTGFDQATEDIVGRYEINDFLMYHLFVRGASKDHLIFLLQIAFELTQDDALRYYESFLKRFNRNQFKRLTGPEGIKIFEMSFSARSDFHYPGDMKPRI